ncbi:6-phosphogluconolactonase [Bosea sp. LjRoot9]|uniref:6-phosphogluconolactonase n=1 Tax=Bosea sp. LjRoot9 TaxID=3342341 RepID=UPI003ECFC854
MVTSGPLIWHRFETLADASEALAEAVAVRLRAVLVTRGSALLAVPGGTTPARFLAALGAHDLAWDKVTLLPTDERFVSADDPASNERMIRQAFAPLGEGRARFLSFHRAAADLDAAAGAVSAELAGLPALDILVSGMGADGHVASLFPGEPAAAMTGRGLHAVPAHPAGLPARISLSPARLTGAAWASLLVSGAEKAEVLTTAQALPGAYPVGLLLGRPQGLDVYWAKA